MASLAPGPLDADQRRLLSAAFKNVMGRCRASWRALTTYASLSEVQSDLELMEMCVVGVPVCACGHTHDLVWWACRVVQYRRLHVEAELRSMSTDLLSTIDVLLDKESKTDGSSVARVFYLKMKVRRHIRICVATACAVRVLGTVFTEMR